MNMDRKYADFATQKTLELLAIDSPTGFTDVAAEWTANEFAALGFGVSMTKKGGVIVDFGGEDASDGILLQAHIDTIGAMVAEVKSNGRLKLTNLGGSRANNTETENVRVYTRGGDVYEGTVQILDPSVHVNAQYDDIKRTLY